MTSQNVQGYQGAGVSTLAAVVNTLPPSLSQFLHATEFASGLEILTDLNLHHYNMNSLLRPCDMTGKEFFILYFKWFIYCSADGQISFTSSALRSKSVV